MTNPRKKIDYEKIANDYRVFKIQLPEATDKAFIEKTGCGHNALTKAKRLYLGDVKTPKARRSKTPTLVQIPLPHPSPSNNRLALVLGDPRAINELLKEIFHG